MYENVYTNTGSQDKSLKKHDCPVMWNAYVSIKASAYNILQYSTWGNQGSRIYCCEELK